MPVATTESVTAVPGLTVWLCGEVVMMTGSLTLTKAVSLVTLPAGLVTVTA